MHIALIELDRGAGKLLQIRVDDELWQNARVPLTDLPPSERSWLHGLAERAVSALLGPDAVPLDDATGLVRLVWEAEGHAVLVQTRNGWLRASADTAASPAARATVTDALEKILDAVQGVLLIDEDARGLTKRTRGDSPA